MESRGSVAAIDPIVVEDACLMKGEHVSERAICRIERDPRLFDRVGTKLEFQSGGDADRKIRTA